VPKIAYAGMIAYDFAVCPRRALTEKGNAMARRRSPSALKSLLIAFDQLPISSQRHLLRALARRPGVAAQMARISLANLSESETCALWKALSVPITPARPAWSGLASMVRGTLVNHERLVMLTNACERERRANRPGRRLSEKNKALGLKALGLRRDGKSLAETAMSLHWTDRDLLPANYQHAPLSAKQKTDLGGYLHKIMATVKKAASQGLL
jgi:hypothetical protein